MMDTHIIDILENTSLTAISDDQMSAIRVHSQSCAECRKAFEAAQVGTVLVRKRGAETFEPPPFFQTRVMAAWRERQSEQSIPAIVRLWKSAGVLVSSMALTTVALAVFSFVLPSSTVVVAPEQAALTSYSAEGVILEDDESDDQISYDQVLNTIYEDEAQQ
jgi:hypothetical protein